jgi:hypothetical protein
LVLVSFALYSRVRKGPPAHKTLEPGTVSHLKVFYGIIPQKRMESKLLLEIAVVLQIQSEIACIPRGAAYRGLA